MGALIAAFAVAEKDSFEVAGQYLSFTKSAIRKRVNRLNDDELEHRNFVPRAIGWCQLRPVSCICQLRANLRETEIWVRTAITHCSAYKRRSCVSDTRVILSKVIDR
jgi:hypothetical protein